MSVTTRTTPRPRLQPLASRRALRASGCHDYHAPPVRTPNDSATCGDPAPSTSAAPDEPTRRP